MQYRIDPWRMEDTLPIQSEDWTENANNDKIEMLWLFSVNGMLFYYFFLNVYEVAFYFISIVVN